MTETKNLIKLAQEPPHIQSENIPIMAYLEKEDLIVLNRNGEQLKSVIRHLLEEFPKSARTISGMSKWLNVNRSNSQRILNSINKSHNGKDVLCMLPGVAGLKEFIEQCKRKKITPVLIVEATKAFETFQNNIKQYSRSHSELKRMLIDSTNDSLENSKEATASKRKKHYQVSKELIGESTEFLFATYVLKVNEKRPQCLQEIALISKQGNSRQSSARPFFQYYSHVNNPDFKKPKLLTNDSPFDDEQFSVGIVKDYSSTKLIEGYSGYSKMLSSLIFNNMKDDDKPFDATYLFHNPDEIENPLTSNTNSSSTAISIKNPTKHLIMMVFIERKLDIRSTVNVGCYSGSNIPEGDLSVDEVWNDKLPEFPELKIVSQNSPVAVESHNKEYGHLTDYLFKHVGLDKNDYVCYLMDVSYPIWSTSYRIYFEHS